MLADGGAISGQAISGGDPEAEALASTSTNAYERSFAYQLAGTAAADAGDKDKALADFKLAVDSNGLNNDEHYQVMFNLAVMQYQSSTPRTRWRPWTA